MLTAEELAEKRNREEARKRPWGEAPPFIWRALPQEERERIKQEVLAELGQKPAPEGKPVPGAGKGSVRA